MWLPKLSCPGVVEYTATLVPESVIVPSVTGAPGLVTSVNVTLPKVGLAALLGAFVVTVAVKVTVWPKIAPLTGLAVRPV